MEKLQFTFLVIAIMKFRRFSTEKLLDLLKNACLKEAIYWSGNRKYPDTDDLVKSSERDEMVSFLLEVCDRPDIKFSLDTFALCVSLLDRFLASFKVKSKYLECLAVASLYIASKIKEDDEKISITSEFLVDCNCKCKISELLRMELMILDKFEWNVNDITAADFLSICQSLIINKYLATFKLDLAKNNNNNLFKRKLNKVLKSKDSFYPPNELDFSHILEFDLKQCLCVNELTTMFRPKELAFTLLSIQIDQIMRDCDKEHSAENQAKLKFYREFVDETMSLLKIGADSLLACKEKVTAHLAVMDKNKKLLDSYLNEYFFEMARTYHTTKSLNWFSALASVSAQLTAIKEEDEDDELKKEEANKNVSNQSQVLRSSQVKVF